MTFGTINIVFTSFVGRIMIPKIINYCWFGGKPLSQQAKKCVTSWKKYCPDYQIKEWNESNFDLKNSCNYVKEAYRLKKWAFVSDYARFKILFDNGGIYLDTDVELIKNLDNIIKKGPYMGYEAYWDNEKFNSSHEWLVNPGLGMAAEPHMDFFKRVLNYYKSQHFLNADGSLNNMTVVERVTKLLKKDGLQCKGKMQKIDGITIYPEDYFCPYNFTSGKLKKTENTYSIHLYSASWQSGTDRLKNRIKRHIPVGLLNFILGIKHNE